MNIKKINKNRGQIMITAVVFFIIISSTIIFGMVTPILKQVKTGQDNLKSKQSYYLANASLEDVVYRIKNGKQYSTTEVMLLPHLQIQQLEKMLHRLEM